MILMYTIVKKEILSPTVVRMVIDAPAVAKKAQPGQFIILRVDEEVEHAIEEGIVFKTLCNPVEIVGYNNPDDRRDPKNFSVCGIKCVEMELGEPDASGRRRPVVKENSEFLIDADCVIMALGTSPNPLIKSTTDGLETQSWGGIIADDTGLTSREGIYAGGDAVTGAATVILAMGVGKNAAEAIDRYISSKNA